MTKRISPFTDFGFKFIFGQEENNEEGGRVRGDI